MCHVAQIHLQGELYGYTDTGEVEPPHSSPACHNCAPQVLDTPMENVAVQCSWELTLQARTHHVRFTVPSHEEGAKQYLLRILGAREALATSWSQLLEYKFVVPFSQATQERLFAGAGTRMRKAMMSIGWNKWRDRYLATLEAIEHEK